MIHGVLAQCTVTDLDRAERWYTSVLDRAPDSRPMPGLLEWQIGEGAGLQVWSEPERAGRSTALLHDSDIDETARRLRDAGITDADPQPGGGTRLVSLEDPDGNRVVLLGS